MDENIYCFIKIATIDPLPTLFLINDVFEDNIDTAN